MTQIARHRRRGACLLLLFAAAMTACADGSSDTPAAALKDVVGGALIVSPTSCFQGLPADVDASSYVLGVQTSTQSELHALVAEIDRKPLFEAQVTVMCTD